MYHQFFIFFTHLLIFFSQAVLLLQWQTEQYTLVVRMF